ncbi:dihydropteroate synthase [Tannerella sp. oral taxon 808]|nr:dihydropteroate synthase [Tannerella sp. oral taxon 808]
MNRKTINLKGTLRSLDEPIVMGILNATPDSFYAGSRQQSEADVVKRIETIISEGGALIDVGGYSSRPDAADVSEADEWARLEPVLSRLQRDYPQVPVSVDTFRSAIARRAVEEYGVAMINDISGGSLDEGMYATIATLGVPYVLMHMRGTPRTMQQQTDYDDVVEAVMMYFASELRTLRRLGVIDVILDPGFGFAKTLDQNYTLMRALSEFEARFEEPLLVGISRKSMIYRLLGGTPDDSLNGTTVLHTYALMHGANILRVHDVRAAVEAVRITRRLLPNDQ